MEITGAEITQKVHEAFKSKGLKLSVVESCKMLFWESTRIGFVIYPRWLMHLYDFSLFKNGLRLLVFIIHKEGFKFTHLVFIHNGGLFCSFWLRLG